VRNERIMRCYLSNISKKKLPRITITVLFSF
jgi:hypothetical protein